MIERTLQIEKRDDGSWTVREGEGFCPHLCWDEMLGMLVTLTHRPGVPNYSMRNMRQHLDLEQQRQARIDRMHVEMSQEERVRRAAFQMLAALEKLIAWHGHRDVANDDALLPAGQQPAEIAAAMRAVAAAKGGAS